MVRLRARPVLSHGLAVMALAFGGIAGVASVAAEDAPTGDAAARQGAVAAAESPSAAFACRFDTGRTWTVEAGKFTSADPTPLVFEVAAIDLDTQAANLVVDGRKAAALKVVRALNANHFLEVANEGFLNLTTIYDYDAAAGGHPAVHSRHFGLIGQPVFAQYAGLCTAK
ncbi:MAG: hypothetical protein ACRCS9_14490 [Hyphomicrobium sp.]